MGQNYSDHRSRAESKEEGNVPEVMALIFNMLDFPSLKEVRLVCKSWLRDAQTHMETRGIIRLNRKDDFDTSTRIQQFLNMRRKRTGALPQTFQSIPLDLLGVEEKFVRQLTRLSPPPVITRLSSERLPWELALQLLKQCAATVEFTKLLSGEHYLASKPNLDPKQNFPKLLHVAVGVSNRPSSLPTTSWTHFSSIVAWVVNASPNLENYESLITDKAGIESELLLQLDLKSLKSLKLSLSNLSQAALVHFKSISFSRLENLELEISVIGEDFPSSTKEAIAGAVRKSALTLKKLKMWECHAIENLASAGFPVCPNLVELTSGRFPSEDPKRYMESVFFLVHHFPALQVWNVSNFMLCERLWSSLPQYLGLKTLRTQIVRSAMPVFTELKTGFLFFQKFPNLQRLYIEPSYLRSCTRLMARSADRRYQDVLQCLKHLELEGDDGDYGNHGVDQGFTFLWFLKGLETLTFMEYNPEIITVPRLKMIQFAWGRELPLPELLEMVKGVDKIVITNCCSFSRTANKWSKKELEEFFRSAPNAGCGCKEWTGSSFKW